MIEVKNYIFEGIPFTTYNKNDGLKKPLIFFFHGFTSDRQKGTMGRGEILAEKGFFVVAIDAYMHGERRLPYFDALPNSEKYKDIFNIAIHTANDAKLLYSKYLVNNDSIIPGKVYAYGVSMGTMVTFYLATIMTELKTFASIVGCPSFVEFYVHKKDIYNWVEDDYYNINLEYYKALDPLINYQRLSGKKIFMGCGIKDQVVPYRFAESLSKKLSPEDIVFKLYDTPHLSTNEMQEDAYAFLLNN
ncbi:MAG: hypothetical protein K0Q49_1568 [Haloplasmataceae bacterium]|jgi:fermentation-respiration switch protein FrsA (DUF1100 family)|nr:hypothetical protein [Haloplasmataceae bacterium]